MRDDTGFDRDGERSCAARPAGSHAATTAIVFGHLLRAYDPFQGPKGEKIEF